MVQSNIAAIDYRRLYEEQVRKNASQEALIAALKKANSELRANIPPMSDLRYEYITNLQYQNKNLKTRVKAFESGEKFTGMKASFNTQFAAQSRIIRDLKAEVARLNSQTVTVRQYWSEVLDDMDKEHKKELAAKDGDLKKMEERALNAERQRDEALDKLRDAKQEMYRALTELEEEKGKNQKLKAQISRDHENSSKPSSMNPNHKKIPNGRENTGKNPGGQPGHKGHPRKWHEPTATVDIPAPAEYADTSRYQPTGRIITKQMVDISVTLVVTEYSTPEYRDLLTRCRVHADFPDGMVNEVTYSGNVKAFAFLLNNRCNVSIANVSGFLSELTGGELNISTGMINGLSKEFSLKTGAERDKAFADLLLSPVMHTDLTNVRVNGKQMYVAVCADESDVMYFAKERKGHEAVKGTPVEDYQHTLVHDHDPTYYNYGGAHSECNQHPSRYLKGHMQNEPDLKWCPQMRDLIQEMIHFRNGLDPKDERDPDEIEPDRVKSFEDRYGEILDLAKDEYEYEPPTKYNMESFNLYKRMSKHKSNHLLFLHDRRVSATNNMSERLLRPIKRKLAQVMTFRSFEALDNLCRSMGTIAMLRAEGGNLYEGVASIYDRVAKQ